MHPFRLVTEYGYDVQKDDETQEATQIGEVSAQVFVASPVGHTAQEYDVQEARGERWHQNAGETQHH